MPASMLRYECALLKMLCYGCVMLCSVLRAVMMISFVLVLCCGSCCEGEGEWTHMLWCTFWSMLCGLNSYAAFSRYPASCGAVEGGGGRRYFVMMLCYAVSVIICCLWWRWLYILPLFRYAVWDSVMLLNYAACVIILRCCVGVGGSTSICCFAFIMLCAVMLRGDSMMLLWYAVCVGGIS